MILHWYVEADDVHDRLYESAVGNVILIAEGTDVPLAAARLLGIDVAGTIGPARLGELLNRWPRRQRPISRRTRSSRRSGLAARAGTTPRPARCADARAGALTL